MTAPKVLQPGESLELEAGGAFTTVYTLRYRAASPDQMLQVTWALDGEPNRFLGQARLQAVTLAPGR